MISMDRQLYQISEIRLLEKYAIEKAGISEETLLERAGHAAFRVMREVWPKSNKVIVICGKGNNGGDGYVLAQRAKRIGVDISIRQVGVPDPKTPAGNAYDVCKQLGVEISTFSPHEVWQADVLVDALLGIGLCKEVEGIYRDAILAINQSQIPVLAIDVPSGVDADTGSVYGIAVNAYLTVTFLGLKRGLFTGAAPSYCGRVIPDRLGLPEEAYHVVSPTAYLLRQEDIKKFLKPRPRDSNKSNFGHVLIIGGYYGMAGAARMAAEAALRVGAGLVSVITLSEHVTTVTGSRPEIMSHGFDQLEGKPALSELFARATVIVIGPGLGKEDWSKKMLQYILEANKPTVVDADALNLLAENPHQQDNWVLTPHPGEASRLLGCSVTELQQNRFKSIEELQNKYGGVCVLKGVGTLIKNQEPEIAVCTYGNPGMASAGMGDVLSGIIGGLIAQGLSQNEAARIGVLIHALAGDAAAKQGERGLIAMDVIQEIRVIVN